MGGCDAPPLRLSRVFSFRRPKRSGQVKDTKSPCDMILTSRPFSSTTGKCLKRSFDIWRSQSITSSSARPVLTSAVIMDESGGVLGSRELLSRRRMRSRSVTMPLTCISSPTITTEPIFLSDIVFTAVGTTSSARKEKGVGLLRYSGLSFSFIGVLFLQVSGANPVGIRRAQRHQARRVLPYDDDPAADRPNLKSIRRSLVRGRPRGDGKSLHRPAVGLGTRGFGRRSHLRHDH